ncbi:hypothetical protein I5535_16870 [Rhodobacteraceae bacterium F11138]|nr:hypothetical protein [Rhodobacteraceae bacterium F11138]
MIRISQRRMAILAAVVLAVGVIAANAHLIAVAVQSQPDCTLSAGMAAKPAC